MPVETIEDTCPDCGSDRIVMEGGCPICQQCGWDGCSGGRKL